MKNKKILAFVGIFILGTTVVYAAWPSLSSRTKNWSSNEILTETDLESSFDEIHTYVNAALNSSTGHAHDGTTANGPKIAVLASTVTSDTTFSGDVVFSNSSGATEFGRTVDVTGDVTASDDLSCVDDLVVGDDASVGGDLTVSGVYMGKLVSYSSSTLLSGTNTATSTYADTGITAITLTPASPTNRLLIMFGAQGWNNTNYGGMQACVRIDSTNQTAYEVGENNGNTNGSSSDNMEMAGFFVTKQTASSHTFTVYFSSSTSAGGTVTCTDAYIQILEFADHG